MFTKPALDLPCIPSDVVNGCGVILERNFHDAVLLARKRLRCSAFEDANSKAGDLTQFAANRMHQFLGVLGSAMPKVNTATGSGKEAEPGMQAAHGGHETPRANRHIKVARKQA